MNKKEAAEYLGVSTRAIERYTKQGKLHVQYQKGKTRPVAVYTQEELDLLKEQLSITIHKPAIEESPTVTDNPDKTPVGISGLLEKIALPLFSHLAALTEAVQNLQPPSGSIEVPIAEKLLLTLPEVQALTGLSRSTLRDAIENEQLPAKIIGKAWRIKRGDLEDYIENL